MLGSTLLACTSDSKAPEEELDLLDDDAKADSQRHPTDHGPIMFDVASATALTVDERFHAWTFELSADAHVTMTTSYAIRGQRRTDTVMYLYRQSSTGWGAYIARNDDYGTTTYSQLVRDLGAGRYRVLVKGHSATTLGKFSLKVGCAGDGCAPVDPDACVFGSTYHDIATAPALHIVNQNKITMATLDSFGPVEQQELVLAVQQSSHTDVMTPAEALAAVDQNEVNVTWIVEPAARRSYIAFEYGAGDNSYGAVFERGGGTMVTNIHDGDLENCTVKAETCLLPADWTALRNSSEFTRTGSRIVTDAAQLDPAETAQAAATFEHVYGAGTTVADGLARADDHQLNVASFTHHATGTEVDVFELGAGDTSVGSIFHAGTTTIAGRINDLDIGDCTLFAN